LSKKIPLDLVGLLNLTVNQQHLILFYFSSSYSLPFLFISIITFINSCFFIRLFEKVYEDEDEDEGEGGEEDEEK
jgi:hypothetical protein